MNMNHVQENKRLAKNTLYLYVRSLIIVVVSLYTSRVVLAALGFANHGLYNLVGSVVAIFNMFSATFISSTQRFLNVEIGRGKKDRITDVFSASLNIHFFLAGIILLLLETIGTWVLNFKLNIPEGKEMAANVVFQLSILSFLINIISIPYNAVIIANEKMNIFAYVSIYEAIMKLLVVYLLSIAPCDILIFYTILMTLIPVSIRIFYGIYCRRNFPEIHYHNHVEKSLYKNILSISGWNFLGSSASILTFSGIGTIINIFTNVVVNSAKGIAGQVERIISQLVNNFTIALRPQITKAYAIGDYEYMKELVAHGTKMSFFLMCFICIPLIALADKILILWLDKTPQYTTEFVQITMLYIIQNSFSGILDMVLLATGKIKYSQIVLAMLQLLNLPLSCIILYMGYKPYLIYVSFIVISYISLYVRVFFVNRYTEIKASTYLKNIFLPLSLSGVSMFLPIIWITSIGIGNILIDLFIQVVLIELCFIAIYFVIALDVQERHRIINIVLKYI